MITRARFLFCWAWLLFRLAAALPLSAQEPTVPPTPSPEPIPIPEIATRASDVAGLLRDVDTRLQPDLVLQDIAIKLPEVARQVSDAAPAAMQLFDSQPPLETIDSASKIWQEREAELRGWNDQLVARAQQLEDLINQLSALNRIWKATKNSLAADTPPAVAERVRVTASSISGASKAVKGQRADVLTMQDTANSELATVTEVLRLAARARALRVQNLFSRDAPPVWELTADDRPTEVGDRLRSLAMAQSGRLSEFVSGRWSTLAPHAAAILVLALLLRRARVRVRELAEQENAWIEIQVLELPIATALLLGLGFFPWLYPQAPRIATDLLGLLAVVPVLRLVRQLVHRRLHPWVYALAGFYIVDRLRAVVATASLLEQLIFLGEMLLAVALLLGLLRPWRLERMKAEVGEGTVRMLRSVGPLLALFFAAAFCASALGFGQLGRLLGGGALQSLYLAITLYAGMRAMEGVLGYLLSTRPLRDLNLVRNHRANVFLSLQRGLRWLAVIVWILGTLSSLALLDFLRQWLGELLSAKFSRGSFSVSLGDVVAFVLTVWLSFVLSRLIRFVLEEDLYPRLHVARGLPYALSRLVHYFVVAVGFVIAAALVGIDIDRLALLLGAFGVGIGFGLQNIVNNFVSGIILLFERPVQVGNFVQLGTLTGRIERIGIRSSTVRTGDGAEVIVPNATLISEPVTNWSLSDRTRQITIPVGVAYGTDPRRVIELLEIVAEQHPEVMRDPCPRALFLRFGESALEFELQLWTGAFENWQQLRSDVAIGINAALQAAGIEIPFPQRELRMRAG